MDEQAIRNKIEFRVGETVTYAPYEKEFPVKITEVDAVSVGMFGRDERIFYRFRLQNIDVVSSGKCIKESIYYEYYEPDDEI